MGKERLDGWKEISDYLNRDMRTCQRWEREQGLPIYRIKQDSSRSKVFSYTSEIDEWFSQISKNNNLEKRKPKFKKWLVPSILILIIVAVFYGLFSFVFGKKNPNNDLFLSNPNPVRWDVKGSHIAFYDIRDNLLWSKEIRNSSHQESFYTASNNLSQTDEVLKRMNRNKIVISDIDRDKNNEVLCYFNHEYPEERCLSLIDNDGRELWSRGIEHNQEYLEGRIVNDYRITKLELVDIDNDEREEVLALWGHNGRFPSIFIIYDLDGNELFRYAHTGILQFFKFVSEKGKDKLIYFGGTNNLLGGDAVLGVLESRNMKGGLGPPYDIPDDLKGQEWVQKYIPVEPERADQRYYIRFRKNEISRLFGVKWMNVLEVRAGREGVFVHVDHGLQVLYSLYYVFDPDFHLKYVSPSADFERNYKRLYAEGKVKLPLEAFLKKCEKDVQFWNGENWIFSRR